MEGKGTQDPLLQVHAQTLSMTVYHHSKSLLVWQCLKLCMCWSAGCRRSSTGMAWSTSTTSRSLLRGTSWRQVTFHLSPSAPQYTCDTQHLRCALVPSDSSHLIASVYLSNCKGYERANRGQGHVACGRSSFAHLQVLKSVDWQKVTVDVVEVAVHSDPEHDTITQFMERQVPVASTRLVYLLSLRHLAIHGQLSCVVCLADALQAL